MSLRWWWLRSIPDAEPKDTDMAKQSKVADTTAKLEQHFGTNSSAAQRVLTAIEGEPARLWRAEELLQSSGVSSMMELLIVLARLAHTEMIANLDLGVYCAIDGVPELAALRSA
jgi:hypothetical protein